MKTFEIQYTVGGKRITQIAQFKNTNAGMVRQQFEQLFGRNANVVVKQLH